VGTCLYMSPEQAATSHAGGGGAAEGGAPAAARGGGAGPGPARYDHKVDVFAAGLVAFELCAAPFATQMERIVSLRGAREGDFPEGTHPHVSQMVRWLAAPEAAQRPTAREAIAAIESWLEACRAAQPHAQADEDDDGGVANHAACGAASIVVGVRHGAATGRHIDA